ncbi:hypothetical protein CHUAL_013702 [Chamberlinius hualienensis]
MPFIGLDWRSPGEEWVKTREGWEKKKLLEKAAKKRSSLDDDRNSEDENTDIDEQMFHIKTSDVAVAWQPYCPITIKCTREIAGFNGLSEAFKRLDFPNAVRDIRRFNYICKLLHLIITQNLTTLSGCAQKVLFTLLETIAFQVSSDQTNIHILQRLLSDLEKTLITYYCWGRPLGSTVLWQQHKQTIHRINSIASCIEIKQPEDDIFPKLQNLPQECLREILLRLSDHKDLENSGQAYGPMQPIISEQHIWRELCKFHFSQKQIQRVLELMEAENERVCDWQKVYHRLRRLFGLKEDYADILHLCRQCRCLFWKSFGHPCMLEKLDDEGDKSSLYVPIQPQDFLKFFSL